MFHKKKMLDAAMKPRQLTSTGKTLQDQFLYRGGNISIRRKLIRNGSMQVRKVRELFCLFCLFLTYIKYKLTSFSHR